MKKIGIVGNSRGDDFGTSIDIVEWTREFGLPIILTPMTLDEFQEFQFDAILMAGGADLDVRRYSKFPSLLANKPDNILEYFDSFILPAIIGRLPIFGICRGMQSLNVIMGGTLHTNLYGHPTAENNAYQLVHKVSGRNVPAFEVTSTHHQAIKELGKGCEILLTSEKDKVVEAIINVENKFAGVQYHPERMYNDIFSSRLFEQILD